MTQALPLTHADRARRGGAVRAASSLSSQEGVWVGLIQKDSKFLYQVSLACNFKLLGYFSQLG